MESVQPRPAETSPAEEALSEPWTTDDHLKELILEKERELSEMNELRVQGLEDIIRNKDLAAQNSRKRYEKLKEDFLYNLKLIEDRDAELERYDAQFMGLKNSIRERDGEISELRAKIAELQRKNEALLEKVEEQEGFLATRTAEARERGEEERLKYEQELRKERERAEEQRRKWAQDLRRREEEAGAQHQDLVSTYDEMLRSREEEFMRRETEYQGRFHEIESKLAEKQRAFDALERSLAEKGAALGAFSADVARLQKENRDLKWRIEDEAKLHSAREQETIAGMAATIRQVNGEKEAAEARIEELLRSMHDVETAFVAQKSQSKEDIAQIQTVAKEEAEELRRDMGQRLQTAEQRLQDAQRRNEVLAEEKAALEQALQDGHAKAQKEQSDLEEARQRRDAERDAEVSSLRSQLAQVQKSAATQLEETKQRLQAQHDNEAGSVRAQLSVAEESAKDLQRRLDDALEDLSSVNSANEDLLAQVQALHAQSGGVDQAHAAVQTRGRVSPNPGLQDPLVSQALKGAPSPLFSDDCGFASPVDSKTSRMINGWGSPKDSPEVDEPTRLKDENEALRGVIGAMRREMELISLRSDPAQSPTTQGPAKALDFDAALRAQMQAEETELRASGATLDLLQRRNVELSRRLHELEGELDTARRAPLHDDGLEAQLATLETRLHDREREMKSLVAERDRLLEVSNSLKAQQQGRHRSDLVVDENAGHLGSLRAEMKMSQQLTSRLLEAEQLIRELSGANRELRLKLGSQPGIAADEPPSPPPRPKQLIPMSENQAVDSPTTALSQLRSARNALDQVSKKPRAAKASKATGAGVKQKGTESQRKAREALARAHERQEEKRKVQVEEARRRVRNYAIKEGSPGDVSVH